MPNSEPARVTEADREAAAELAIAMQMDNSAHLAREGDVDHQPLVQAFARHRIASTPPTSPGWQDYERGLEDAARLMEEHCGWLPGKAPDADMRCASNADYAAAIRALKSPAAPECGR